MSALRSLFTRARLVGLALAVFVAALDQLVKWFVTGVMAVNSAGDQKELLPFFDLTYTRNYGISLGMLEATSLEMRWGLVLVTGLIAGIVLIWMMREERFGDIAGLALILGGAIGNIYDRFRFGYVIDYADLHIGDFRPFLIFNVADAAITIGVVLILARALFFGEKDEDKEHNASGPAPEPARTTGSDGADPALEN
ncbi:MAG: signal peptidase II [Pseudomonadota bacterium]